MKKYLLCFLALNLGLTLWGQRITGIVTDQSTGLPVDYASVFFSGTFVGCTTDEHGRFDLDAGRYSSRPLSISAMGYYSVSITDYSAEKDLQVLLVPKVFEIGEVKVSTKSLVRKRRACMRIFKREFIGFSNNADKCYILNEEDISFNYGSDKDTLKAHASKPLRIMNLSLGYDITYHLDRFEYARKTQTTLYTGDIIFNRDLGDRQEDRVKFRRRRANAYTGSCSHFFRCLWADDLEESGFYIRYARNGEALGYSDLVIQDSQGMKYLVCYEDLDVDFFEHPSHMSFIKNKVYFEEDGYYDPIAVIWRGTMARQRIADFLPYEYLPGKY
jgi:hypothetical protein